MQWINNNATMVVVDVNLNMKINYQALFNLMPLDPIDISKCIFRYKKVERCATPPGSVVYAGHGPYKKGIPHRLTTKNNFHNSTSLSISLGDGRYASVTVYKNKVHLCGCRSEEEIHTCMSYLFNRMFAIQAILQHVKERKEEIISYIRECSGISVIIDDKTYHVMNYNAIDWYQRFGDIVYVFDSYFSLGVYAETAIFFVECHCNVDVVSDIQEPYISYIDYHNIHFDYKLGFTVDLAALSYIASQANYQVDYSNVNLNHVSINIPYDDTDNTTRRKKSRFVINIYRTGSVKCYGPTFNGIRYHYGRFLDLVEENKSMILPITNHVQ